MKYEEFRLAIGATNDAEIKEENKKLCERYPFLKYRSEWSGEDIAGYDYDFTYLDDMPSGWKKAFGIKMCEELRDILIKGNYLDEYRVVQVKEKFGALRWYDNGVPRAISDEYLAWLSKYENLSEHTCIVCGEPGPIRTAGWISPYCDKCYKKT